MKIFKLILALPLIGISMAASAEIMVDDQKKVTYGDLAINADRSVLVKGNIVAKCNGGKMAKSKLATVTCDDDFITVKDKAGNSLTRFSGYAKANAKGGVEERKQFDEALSQIGSGTTGAAILSKTETTVLTTESTVKTATLPAPGTAEETPVKPPVNEKNYIPKLGVEASKTPAITNKNRPADNIKDKKVEKFIKEQKAKGDEPITPATVTVKTTEAAPTVVETTKTTTLAIPADGGEPVTDTELKAKVIQEPAASQ